jgi:cell division protein FtsB
LVAVFGRALADANALEQRHAREEATNATLRAEVAAGRAEIAFIQTDDFLTYEARSYGMGAPGEHAFALEPGAPDPRPITPLGSADEAPASTSPLDDWLKLLLGG